MSGRRIAFYISLALLLLALVGMPIKSQFFTQTGNGVLIAGRNVNMVAGTQLPDGDPYLQRQNEPSLAVSTRNPLHLLAGANDYRTVDMPTSEGPLPGIPEGAAAGDAWLGVFKSFNGGESWISGLLPGHPYDQTQAGRNSPLYGRGVACDPTVRAAPNGLFYYSGIAFDRIKNGLSVIFVARFIDNNVTKLGDVDPIKYLDTIIVDQGTSGQFADKPWIAVDSPRGGSGTVPIYAPDTPVQNVARHNVYIVYSIFVGSLLSGGDQSKIMFARSTDCGTTWEKPIKISESNLLNQGTTIAVSPKDGTIYVAWRRFGSSSEPSSIMTCKSTDFGQSFTKAVAVAPNINAFDQFSAINRFRTYAFPTLAVDRDGNVYVAWSERVTPEGDARIVISTSTNGVDWSSTSPIDTYGGRGHQIMPSLTYAAGRLTMTWYDTRNSEGGYGNDISDPGPSEGRHTIDIWVAQAGPSLNPTFADFTQVSKYLYWVETDAEGKVPDDPTIIRKENNYPNFPLFDGGAKPFIGDYIDTASAPTFLFDVNLETQAGSWRFNTLDSDPATSFISWADNRDVRPPSDGDWTLYNPPNVPSSTTPCTDSTRTGMRNQNIYSSHITQGLMIGSPVNTKRLQFPSLQTPQKRTFLVFARNLTEYSKQIRLTIETPPGMQASFWEFGPPAPENCEYPLLSCGETTVDVEITPYSSQTLTVFAGAYEVNPYATFRIKVEEIDGSFLDYIVLNPDPENTRIVPVLEEYHTPIMMVESPADVNFTDPTMLSQSIVYAPNSEFLNFVNPDVVTPSIRGPSIRGSNVVNPSIRGAAVGDWPDGEVTDIQWRITNNNNTTSAYSFVPIGDPPALPEGEGAYQLLIYRISTTPTSEDCALLEDEHHELILKLDTPSIRGPSIRGPSIRGPSIRGNTFCLAPGETAVCTLRIIENNPSSGSSGTLQSSGTLMTAAASNGFNPSDYAKTVGAAAVAQAANPDGQIGFACSLYIIKKDLPVAWVNDPYPQTSLEAFGGTPTSIDDHGTPNDPSDDIWKYDGKWTAKTLYYPSGQPSGLSLDANGNIWGIPIYYPDLVYPQVLSFIAEVTDISNPPQFAQREFTIAVNCAFHKITATAGTGGSIIPSGEVKVAHGTDSTFEIEASNCYRIADVKVDNISQGSIPEYTFTDVRADHTIDAVFAILTYTIKPTVDPPEGGTIDPSVTVTVFCGGEQKFTMSPNEGYLLKDVIVDEVSQGPLTEYTFYGVVSNHTITAKFQRLESWVKRYNNDDMNGNDEAAAVAVDAAGNVYVTGRSQGSTTGLDYATIKYDSSGNQVWRVRYNNNDMNGDDEAKAIAIHKPSGNVHVTGYSTGRTTGPDFCTIRYSGKGVQGWSARYDGPAHLGDYATAVAVDNAGNAFVTGYGYRGMQVKHSDYATLKYNNSGNLVWNAQYDDRRNGNDEIRAIALDNLGFVYITGRSEDSLSKNDPKHYDYYTIKYSPNTGTVVWAQRYDSGLVVNGLDEATGIAVDADGNVYVTGRSQGGATGFDYATIKYNSSGIQQWVRRYNNSNLADEAMAIAIDAAGNVSVTGRSQGSTSGFDYATVQYDSSGNQKWVQRYDFASGADEAAAVALDAAGNVYVTGRSQGSTTGFDYATIKYDSSGKQVWRVRYNNNDIDGADEAAAIAVDAQGNIYVTGRSQGGTTGLDYATVKYKQ